MNFTQEQISDLLFELANEKGGTHLLLNLTLDAFMKAERSLHQSDNPGEYANGYRYCKAIAQSKELVLKVPRTRSGMFYPSLLAVIRDEDEERRRLIFSLYSKGQQEKYMFHFMLFQLQEEKVSSTKLGAVFIIIYYSRPLRLS